MQPVRPRPDPAPSRWAYRMQRLMLTPLFRLLLRAGVPFAIGFAALWLWLSEQDNRDRVLATYHDIRAAIEARPEFRVRLMAIDGAGAALSEDIRDILSLDFPLSSFDIDLAAIRDRVRELPAVAAADVRVRSGGVLQLDVVEREAVALWRTRDGLDKLDAEGVVIGSVRARAEAPDLPLIAGQGAAERVPEALALVAAVAPLAPRLRGLVRIGARRWDVVLDGGQRIMLPGDAPVRALERVIALDQAQEVMARDIAAVDMRITHRPTIRLRPSAREEWARISRMSWGDSSE